MSTWKFVVVSAALFATAGCKKSDKGMKGIEEVAEVIHDNADDCKVMREKLAAVMNNAEQNGLHEVPGGTSSDLEEFRNRFAVRLRAARERMEPGADRCRVSQAANIPFGIIDAVRLVLEREEYAKK